jgi:peptidoglycan LD-endopeptidase LytH
MNALLPLLERHRGSFGSILPPAYRYQPSMVLDLSVHNAELNALLNQHHQSPIDVQAYLSDMEAYIQAQMQKKGAAYAWGGYDEERSVYQRSTVFDTASGSRSIHLGVDVWLPQYTPIHAAVKSWVHSFANNDREGDYGATIILAHSLEGLTFYTLYGHLSLQSLQGLYEGKEIAQGQAFCELGEPKENGNWVPHLHFQIIADMADQKGDFIGVAAKAERERYLALCPDPNWILDWKA